MNVNSFLLKGWAITLVAALFALAAKDANPQICNDLLSRNSIILDLGWLLHIY